MKLSFWKTWTPEIVQPYVPVTLPIDLQARVAQQIKELQYGKLDELGLKCSNTFESLNWAVEAYAKQKYGGFPITEWYDERLMKAYNNWKKAVAELKAYQEANDMGDIF